MFLHLSVILFTEGSRPRPSAGGWGVCFGGCLGPGPCLETCLGGLFPGGGVQAQGHVFTPVCHSVHMEGCLGPGPGEVGGSAPWGVSRPRPKGVSRPRLQVCVCVSQHALRQTPLPPSRWLLLRTVTHPTGMHSCFSFMFENLYDSAAFLQRQISSYFLNCIVLLMKKMPTTIYHYVLLVCRWAQS